MGPTEREELTEPYRPTRPRSRAQEMKGRVLNSLSPPAHRRPVRGSWLTKEEKRERKSKPAPQGDSTASRDVYSRSAAEGGDGPMSRAVGPELEVPGYGCEDHFLELDTVEHSWECVEDVMRMRIDDDDDEEGDLGVGGVRILSLTYDFFWWLFWGVPALDPCAPLPCPRSNALRRCYCPGPAGVMYDCRVFLLVGRVHLISVMYNCRVFLLDGRILLIRPKMSLANDGNYREARYFTTWKKQRVCEDHPLPPAFKGRGAGGGSTCPFGDGVLQLDDATLAAETCEELFTPHAPNIDLALAGVDIISNGSGSHHQLRKLDQRLQLIQGATSRSGGVYLYANQRGCDGGRLYFDGCACVALNGNLVAQGTQFGLKDVEVVTATVDLDEVVSYRCARASQREQASSVAALVLVPVDFKLCVSKTSALTAELSEPAKARIHKPEEEIAFGPACWLWDYLSSTLIQTSCSYANARGADSSSTAAIVGAMCQYSSEGDGQVTADARRILANRVMVVQYSSEGDEQVTADARRIGMYSPSEPVDDAQELANRLLTTVYMGTVNSSTETRSSPDRSPGSGSRGTAFMLGAAEQQMWTMCSEGYRKDDCSVADINPIGEWKIRERKDLRRFLRWGSNNLGYPELGNVEAAPPTAELEPLREGIKPQELSEYGRLRKISQLGPVSMYRQCLRLWRDRLSPAAIAAKVQTFFRFYAINRHKTTVLTPSYHAESYSPDDNRFDHRQFLYNVRWPWQFKKIDDMAADATSTTS
eukprot:gene5201-18428_t